jgi:3',5'-cyclic-AMP phosphodiesterase
MPSTAASYGLENPYPVAAIDAGAHLMSRPTMLLQLSDLHLGAAWEGIESLPRLERVIDAILALPNRVDAVLVSGDLSDDGSEESYRLAREALQRLQAPLHVLPGNHDDRGMLRAVFELPGSGEEPVNYSAEVGELRLVLLDSIVPGQDPGALSPERLAWLDAELGKDTVRPTILAMHHAPLATGIAEWDEVNWEDSGRSREQLGAVVARHRQLRAIVAGHLHRAAASTLAGCPVVSAPSTYLQALPDFESEDVEMAGPPGYALHVLRAGELSSQFESVRV